VDPWRPEGLKDKTPCLLPTGGRMRLPAHPRVHAGKGCGFEETRPHRHLRPSRTDTTSRRFKARSRRPPITKEALRHLCRAQWAVIGRHRWRLAGDYPEAPEAFATFRAGFGDLDKDGSLVSVYWVLRFGALSPIIAWAGAVSVRARIDLVLLEPGNSDALERAVGASVVRLKSSRREARGLSRRADHRWPNLGERVNPLS